LANPLEKESLVKCRVGRTNDFGLSIPKYLAYQYSRQPSHFLLIQRLPVGHVSFLSVLFDTHFGAAALLLWFFGIENFWCYLYGGLLALSRGMIERDLERVPKEWFVGSGCVRDFHRISK
jgi:hypothetical protein